MPSNAIRRRGRPRHLFPSLLLLSAACGGEAPLEPPPADTLPPLLRVPVVVHVLHRGEAVGSGNNHTQARILRQIQLLNDDFRRREGTRGWNDHPDGADPRIEFVLATEDPEGRPTDGIVRVDVASAEPPEHGSSFQYWAHYSYWDPERYLNVWSVPLEEVADAYLGEATGPETDLPGSHLLAPGEPIQPEGILVNAPHLGEAERASPHALGRTLTHEMGHYLGLLHLWGDGECGTNDYCADTPAVSGPIQGCGPSTALSCDGSPVQARNYMTYAPDACMDLFTRDQVARMRHVLLHSPRRPHQVVE